MSRGILRPAEGGDLRKTCPACKRVFRTNEERRVYCGESCKRRAQNRRYYERHKPRPTCSADGCDRPTYARGMCNMHWQRWRRARGKLQKPMVCTVEGCEGAVRSRGYCDRHYRRLRLYGDPLGQPEPWREDRRCAIEDCDRKHYALGVCRWHYDRQRRGV